MEAADVAAIEPAKTQRASRTVTGKIFTIARNSTVTTIGVMKKRWIVRRLPVCPIMLPLVAKATADSTATAVGSPAPSGTVLFGPSSAVKTRCWSTETIAASTAAPAPAAPSTISTSSRACEPVPLSTGMGDAGQRGSRTGCASPRR